MADDSTSSSQGDLKDTIRENAQGPPEAHGDISGILSNVSNKFLLEGFFSVDRTWGNICAILYNPA